MRSLELGADNTFTILIQNINDINNKNYRNILEMDLFMMLLNCDVKELYPFFQVDAQEEILEQIGDGNVFCNFVQILVDSKAPPMWNSNEGMQFSI